MSTKPVALILGGSGRTGQSVVNGLLEKGDFTVRVAVRPASIRKPVVVDLQRRGAEIAKIDLATASGGQLEETLQDVHTVICTLPLGLNRIQPQIIDAAARVGVKRFIPTDFGTPGRKGVRVLHDDKLAVREYVKKSGVPYTFVDVGLWYQYHFVSVVPEQAVAPMIWEGSRTIYDDGSNKAAFIDISDIGRYVARIIADERTLNQYVFVWGEEVTIHEIFAVAEEITGRKVERIHQTGAQLQHLVDDARAQGHSSAYHEYLLSMWVLGEDRKEQAVLPELGGAILGNDLYPDFKPRSARDFALEYYAPYKL